MSNGIWYRWQSANELRNDPDYQRQAREGSGEWTASDLLWMGLTRLWPDDMPRRAWGGDPARHPQHRERIERARRSIEAWNDEWTVTRLCAVITREDVATFVEALK